MPLTEYERGWYEAKLAELKKVIDNAVGARISSEDANRISNAIYAGEDAIAYAHQLLDKDKASRT